LFIFKPAGVFHGRLTRRVLPALGSFGFRVSAKTIAEIGKETDTSAQTAVFLAAAAA
jgi:hypothetical protein